MRIFIGLALLVVSLRAAAPLVSDLRVDGQPEPLGLDEAQPTLSWRLESGERAKRQTACEVLVASSLALLAQDRGDLWSSGVIQTNETTAFVYAGTPLKSWQRVYWKTRIWDEQNSRSEWSAPAAWSVGALDSTAWDPTTRWITDPELLRWERHRLGYRSLPAADPASAKWIQLDLRERMPIERVRLHGVAHTVDENLGFPRQYRLEVADHEDFNDGRIVAELTGKDANPWVGLIDLPLTEVTGRYVRFTATKLRQSHGESCHAVSQIEVLSKGRNVAPTAAVKAIDSTEDATWALSAINDGLGVPGANPRASDSLRLRRVFTVRPGLERASFAVCGLGQATLAINGAAVDAQRLLTPGWTDYRKTCLYDSHEVTRALHPGENAIGLTLAGGMYNVQPGFGRYLKFVSAYRPLKAFGELRLEYADGSVEVIGTDDQWRAQAGPITYSNVFGGEDYDARRDSGDWSTADFDGARWNAVTATDGPGGTLRGAAWTSPAFTAHEVLPAVSVREMDPRLSVYDFGQNASMMPKLRVHGPAGATVRMIPAELTKPDGLVDRASAGGKVAYWQYTLRGDAAGEEWSPSFFYHGARYLQVERTSPDGSPLPIVDGLESVVVHSDSPAAGTFTCSDELFNRIHSLVRWAQRSNLAHVFTDCPHRERLGWLEQYHLTGPALRYEWDVAQLFAKGFNDMADAQRDSGLIPDIAPEYVVFNGGFVDSPEWGSALILAGWQHYLFTGDPAPLRRHYSAMQRYFDYLTTRADHGIVSHGLGDWYDIGPKPPGVAQLTPIALTATAIYYEDAQTLTKIARLLGRNADADRYDSRAGEIREAFNAQFLNHATGVYASGSQTAQAMPLVLGLVPEAQRVQALAALLKDLADRGSAITAGDVGYRYLLRALADSGHSDAVFAMNHQSERPGYGYQLAQGATSLTEAWDANPHSSQNHFMLGQIMEWFYEDLAGLSVDPANPGFKNTLVRPQPVGGLTWAEATHQSPWGAIKVRWSRDHGKFKLNVTVPANATATVFLPAAREAEALEGGEPAAQSRGVKFLRREGDRDVFAIQSGTYQFESPWP